MPHAQDASAFSVQGPNSRLGDRLVLWGLIAVGLVAMGHRVEATIYERFESPEPSWRTAESDCSPGFVEHKRTFNESHSDQGCEYLSFRAGQGTHLYLVHDVDPARVIEELTPQVWVKSDRAGIQLFARVVLPRSLKPDGSPHTALLPGGSYESVGAWEQLRVEDILRELERQVWILRRQFGPEVDAREAFIDMLVLNAFGGVGTTNLWIDDLELGSAAARVPTRFSAADAMRDSLSPRRSIAQSAPMVEQPVQVRLRGSVLSVNDRTMVPRVIEFRGESFAWLKELGFNTVLLPGSPTPAQLKEAKQTGLWLIASPPVFDPESTESFDRVLAWNLGDQLSRRDVPVTLQLAHELRSERETSHRPLVATIVDEWASMGGEVDIVIPHRSVLDTPYNSDHFGWYRRCALRQQLGSPFWASMDTEIPVELEQQIAAISGQSSASMGREVADLRRMAMEAVAAGARGFCFRSRSRLDAGDSATELRAATLTWVNQDLARVEPWIAGGTYQEEIEVPEVHTRARVLSTERSRLVVVTREANVPDILLPRRNGDASFVLHGLPITDQAFRIGAARLQPLRGERRNGIRVPLDGFDLTAMFMLTQDPLAINHVRRQLAETGRRSVEIQQKVAELLLTETTEIDRQCASYGQLMMQDQASLPQAATYVEQGRKLLKTGDVENAGRSALHALDVLQRVRNAHTERTARAFPSPDASPLIATFRTLPLHWDLVARMRSLRWGPNELAAGEFEDLGHMQSVDWDQSRSQDPRVRKEVELSLQAPQSGRSSLHLRASADNEGGTSSLAEWPITIRSGPVEIQHGDLLRIAGWIRVPRSIRNSDDGVMIFDSCGGPRLAQRIGRTDGWQEFSLYRAATYNGSLTVTFALTGLGEVWLDDVVLYRVPHR